MMKETEDDTNRCKDIPCSWMEKNQYYQNDYTAQGNPEIQNHPYLITNGIFHRIITKKLNLYRNTKDPE